ncbi:TAM domain methyltransferase [Colletotrichum costaricense]|uniref:TAM domain methyltransferase n=1 Tax=Colletotrichum costaricense TaxID=1209916 RepID=A0AAI9YM83_9PEZI|nr:TAM domain methyltransferase [Colletotrichum costaricense]KAK1515772.1 TAM domain methyltransferase [Colletotrichum costaricense]
MPADPNQSGPCDEADGDLKHVPFGDSSGSFSSSFSSADKLDGTESLISNLRLFSFENKRRYHKYEEGRYMLPNDDIEQDREDMKHSMIVHVCNGALHNAPLRNPQRVLDIGTGTGIWAMEMGDDYPEAEIIGLDLSPIQPEYVPPNVHFTVDDVEADWLHAPNSVDYVHVRNMAPALKDWPRLLSQAYRALKPGGWFEMQDLVFDFLCDDGTVTETYKPREAMRYLTEALATFDVDVNIARNFAGCLESAGFTNQIHDMRKVPVGTWPKDPDLSAIGDYCRAVNYDSLGAITNLPFTRGLGWSRLRVEVFLIEVRKDLLNNSFHPYHYYHSYSGQKPLQQNE